VKKAMTRIESTCTERMVAVEMATERKLILSVRFCARRFTNPPPLIQLSENVGVFANVFHTDTIHGSYY
jgi:hypothetical protein